MRSTVLNPEFEEGLRNYRRRRRLQWAVCFGCFALFMAMQVAEFFVLRESSLWLGVFDALIFIMLTTALLTLGRHLGDITKVLDRRLIVVQTEMGLVGVVAPAKVGGLWQVKDLVTPRWWDLPRRLFPASGSGKTVGRAMFDMMCSIAPQLRQESEKDKNDFFGRVDHEFHQYFEEDSATDSQN